MFRARIVGTGHAVPDRVLTNKDLESIVDTTDEWITRRTGIKERRICSDGYFEETSELAARASLKALDMANVSPDRLDMIVVGTVTPDRILPASACLVQHALKAKKAVAFDVAAGCSGFLFALSIVGNAIASGACRNALVIGAERLSSILNWEDRSTCVLMGDGAGAAVLTSTSKSEGVLSTHLKSDGDLWELLYYSEGASTIPDVLKGVLPKPHHLMMDGNALFKKAVALMADVAATALEHNGVASSEVKLVIPHQANLRILKAVADRLGMPMEQVYTNLEKYGNTSAASIPIALDEANRKGLLQPGDYVLMVAFGGGLTWASSLVKWAP